MDIKREKELRDSVADFILNWHTDGKPEILDGATSEDFSRLIVEAYIASDEASKSLKQWVQSGRRAGLSWADVGKLLGISRQAAQQRFSMGSVDSPNFDPKDPTRIVVPGVTAFNEVEVLKTEGAIGREVVGATWFTLYFKQTDAPVENIRVISPRGSGVVKQYETLGWRHVLTWYPYRYFTRPLISD